MTLKHPQRSRHLPPLPPHVQLSSHRYPQRLSGPFRSDRDPAECPVAVPFPTKHSLREAEFLAIGVTFEVGFVRGEVSLDPDFAVGAGATEGT